MLFLSRCKNSSDIFTPWQTRINEYYRMKRYCPYYVTSKNKTTNHWGFIYEGWDFFFLVFFSFFIKLFIEIIQRVPVYPFQFFPNVTSSKTSMQYHNQSVNSHIVMIQNISITTVISHVVPLWPHLLLSLLNLCQLQSLLYSVILSFQKCLTQHNSL